METNRTKRYAKVERGIEIDLSTGHFRARTTDAAGNTATAYAAEKEDARAWLAAARSARKSNLPPPPSPLGRPAQRTPGAELMTLEQYAAKFFAGKRATAEAGIRKGTRRRQAVLRPDTIDGYESTLRNRVFPYIGTEFLALPRDGGLTKDKVVRMRDALAADGYAQESQRDALMLVRRLLDEAIEDGIEAINVAKSVQPIEPKNPKRKRNPHGQPLTMRQRLDTVSSLPPELQAAGLVEAVVALRVGETCGLKLADCYLWTERHGHVGWLALRRQRRHRTVDETVNWLKSKDDDVARWVPLPPTLVDFLRWYIDLVAPGYLPGDIRGNQWLVRGPRRRSKDQPGQYVYPRMSAGSWSTVFKGSMERTPGLRFADVGFAITPQTLREDCLSELKGLVNDYVRSTFAGHSMVEHTGDEPRGSRTTDNPYTYGKVGDTEVVVVAHALEKLLVEALDGRSLIPPTTLTTYEVAHRAGISHATVHRLASKGLIPAERVHVSGQNKRAWRFDPSVVETVAKLIHPAEDSCWSVREASEILGMSPAWLYNQLKAGKVPTAHELEDGRYERVWRLPAGAIHQLAATLGRPLPDVSTWPGKRGR